MFTIVTADKTKFEITKIADLEAVPTPALLETYNQLAGKNTKKFASREVGIKQLWPLISETAATPAPVVKKRSAGRKDSLDGLSTIRKLVDENPKRPNTQAHAHWEKYQNGMTVDKLQKGRGVPLSDIRWNLDKGFIELLPRP